ncbi:hypothetical protein KS4_25240 [Poriferisphaera corsica]|uniref:Methyltransferase FkbM domain-containing protein n=1 Tax=Poriferisphaera corsica TaxID=2528020 RepID=A0A517YW42_9BACT|nr:FkbM family methyltransferase [Poriferisphaera corsica]QDU34454.1 hypothetical protein KS4_25240 [Poriferisphaera corsica]
MSFHTIKQKYWTMLNKIEQRRHPYETVLSPHDWQSAIDSLLPHNTPITLVDGGAHDGIFAKQYAQNFSNIHIHAFEPNTELAGKLSGNLSGIPHTINHTALGNTVGSTTFNIGDSPMTSSVLNSNQNGRQFYHDVINPKESRTIPITTLDHYAKKHNIQHIHILKLDLQGYELHALQGAEKLLKNKQISCIFTEINFMPFYDGSALFSDLDQYLRPLGYQLHNLYNLATRNHNNQLSGGDALFITEQLQQQTIAA